MTPTVIETIHDIAKLQQDLWNMQDWSASWLLNLNFEKCKVMHIGNTPHSDYYVTVSGNSTSLSDAILLKRI